MPRIKVVEALVRASADGMAKVCERYDDVSAAEVLSAALSSSAGAIAFIIKHNSDDRGVARQINEKLLSMMVPEGKAQ